jgi:hypothetical protein
VLEFRVPNEAVEYEAFALRALVDLLVSAEKRHSFERGSLQKSSKDRFQKIDAIFSVAPPELQSLGSSTLQATRSLSWMLTCKIHQSSYGRWSKSGSKGLMWFMLSEKDLDQESRFGGWLQSHQSDR